MTFRSQLSAARQLALCSLYRRPVSLGNCGAFVSFSFDDFPRSAYTSGGRILKSRGVRGTYYAAIGLMNTVTEVGQQFCQDDLFSLIEDGHELGSHTLNHVSSRSTPCALFLDDADRGRRALESQTGVSAADNFAYPFGHVTFRMKRTLGSRMLTCRSTVPGINGPQVDLNLLKANKLYGDEDRAGAALRLIDEAKKCQGWLIFYSHDVSPNPSSYGCTPSLLESVVCHALCQGCHVMNVRDVLCEIGVGVQRSGAELAVQEPLRGVCAPTLDPTIKPSETGDTGDSSSVIDGSYRKNLLDCRE